MKTFNISCYSKSEFDNAQIVLLKMGYYWIGSFKNEFFNLFNFNFNPIFPILINCHENKSLTFDDDYGMNKDDSFYIDYNIIKYNNFIRRNKLKKINNEV